MSWKDTAENKNTLFVAPPSVYGPIGMTAGEKLRLRPGVMTRSVQVAVALTDPDDLDLIDVRLGFTSAGVDGDNNFPVGFNGFAEVFQTSELWIKCVGTGVKVSVLAVLSDVEIAAPGTGAIAAANGFDGGDSSTAITLVAAP